ncbi:MAG: tape measure protein, partial [Dolichospermum sp.]
MPARALGLYNNKTNQVEVSQDFYDVIKSGKMTIDQFNTIAHELRHAVQFDFGRIKADVEEPAIKLISPSSEQLSQFATTIEGSVTHAVTHSGSENEPRIRAIEADAYAFADNVKDSIALSVRKALSVSQFQSQFGIGGGKTTLAIGTAQRDALLRLKKIKTFVDEYGVDVSSEISATLENIEAISASIKPLISKAADIESLSPSDIANLSNNITEGYTKTVELINKEVESFKNNAIAKIKQSQTQSIHAPTKEEFKSTLQEQYTSTGLRQVAQKLGHVNVNKYKKKDLIELISQSGATQVDNVLASFGDSIKKQSFKTGTPNILPVAQAKEVINELKAGTARVQALLKSFATSTNSERQGIIEQVVIEANKQTHQIDELFKKNQLPKGLGRQASGFRNYFEAIRQELVPEMIANNVSAVQKLYRQSGYRSEGLASFEDIKNEISRLINEIKQSVGAVDPEVQFREASAKIHENLKRIYKDLDKFSKAENIINRRYTAATDPNPQFSKASARIYENSKRFDEAANAINQKLTNDEDPKVQFREAVQKIQEIMNRIYENVNRFDEVGNVINRKYAATDPEVQFHEISAEFREILNEMHENLNRFNKEKYTGDKDPKVQFDKAVQKIQEIINRIYENVNRFDKVGNVINEKYAATDPEVQFDEASAKIHEILNEMHENLNEYVANTASQLDAFGGKDNGFKRFILFVKSELNGNNGFLSLIKKSAGVVAGFIASFIGLQTIQAFSEQLKQFADRSIEVASNLEVIKSNIYAVSGSSVEASKNIQLFTKQSKELGLNRQTVLEGATTFLAATQDTQMEGDVSREILSNFNVMVRNRNLNQDQQGRALVALGQMASKGTIQTEELKGQLAEALPGSYQTFARSLGLSSKQFAK